MATSDRIHLPFHSALGMLGRYARSALREQLRAVAFVVIYLVAFQIIAFGRGPADALRTAGGIAMVVVGLAFFLEGLRLGLMPLGERVGIQLSSRGGLIVIVVLGVLVGVGSTLAEPAIAALRAAGAGMKAWEAPLLFVLLERMPGMLVLAVGVGVGVAVALGLVRFYFGFSLKPLVLTIIPVLLVSTILFSRSERLSAVIGLAWDTGAVTTGAVTVPLVLALGIGVSRASGKREGAGSGFGVVMLASSLPVLGVMMLALAVFPRVPPRSNEAEFFSADRRDQVLGLFADEAELLRYAFVAGGEHARRAFFDDEAEYLATLDVLGSDPGSHRRLLGDLPFGSWLAERASEGERRRLGEITPHSSDVGSLLRPRTVIAEEAVASVRAVLPLTALLGIVLVLLLRDRPRYLDEVVLGIVLALAGMALLTSGIRLGLAPLGDDVGRQLPQALRHEESDGRRIVIEAFDPQTLITAVDEAGGRRQMFHFFEGDSVRLLEFVPDRYDGITGRYTHYERSTALFHPDLPLVGIVVVLLFAFGMGYGSTLAEPALNALGHTVEDVTVGTVRRGALVRAVSIGVGIGLIAGVLRILYDIPMVWMLVGPYLLLLPLTAVGEETFTGVAWDCGGVTTGTITVPLVIAMGLGLGSELGMVDGFGILALASVYPILTVQLYGLFVGMRQRRAIREAEEGAADE